MKKIVYILLLCLPMLSCQDASSLMDKEDVGDLYEKDVFRSGTYARYFVNDIYYNIISTGYGVSGWGGAYMDCATDNGEARPLNSAAHRYNTGNWNAADNPLGFIWTNSYAQIRACNKFLENYHLIEEESGITTRLDIEYLRAQVIFLRAYFYHQAWMAYGGLPIITVPLDRNTQGDAIFYPRATSEETFEFITRELGECAADLPNEVGAGHATQGAALTLKGWCELFAQRYDLAAATNWQVMQLGVYDLYKEGYNALFTEKANNCAESIFAYQHVPGNKISQRSMLFGPIGAYNGWGFMQPTQNLVEEFRMASGLPTGEDGSFDPQNPYVGREPRFYESIIYHKSTFSGKVYEINDLYDPASNLYTGYFRRKGISEPLNLGQEGYNFMFFRFAEVLLSYAEAKIELNEIDDTVLDAIDRVRRRGGLPSLEETYGKTTFMQAELRDVVRTERRIELAFEGKRYWDLIRWREAERLLNLPVRGISYENGRYVEKNVHAMKFDASKNYLFPMDQSWIDINPRWQEQTTGEFNRGQNPGY